MKSSAGSANLNVSLSAASAYTVTVAYATADGTAAAGTAYVSTSGTLTFPPGTTAQTIPVTVIATTGWTADRLLVEGLLTGQDAAAVVASNFSLGVARFGRLIDQAVAIFGRVDAFDP